MSPSAETIRYAGLMLAAGIGIPILATLNAALGQRIGSPSAAALCLFAIAFAVTALAVLYTGPAPLRNVPGQPPHLFFAGVLIAFYVLSITWVAPRFGVGNAIFFILLGQLAAAAVIDHFGLFGAPQTPLTWTRVAGIAVMAAGVALTQRA